MSYPKKAKGWRNLTLENQQFRWRFIPKSENSILKIQSSSSSGKQAIFTLHEWRDVWITFGQSEILLNEPKVITPKFAAQAVIFALQNGWKPGENGSSVYFEFMDGKFTSR